MRIFISQPMAGKTDREIQTKRDAVIEMLKSNYPDCEILDTFFKDDNGNPVEMLGKSILKLSEADLAVFLDGWDIARGCKIEEMIARGYGIQCLYL